MGVKEEVTQRADYYSSMLQIQLTGAYLPKAKTPQYEFDRLQKAKDDAYTNTVSNLLVPYLSGDVLAHIVLGFMGPLRYQITYSVDMLPILHSTVSKPRKSMWITPNHAVYFPSQRVWSLPRDVGTVVSRHQGSIFNFIVDQGHVINVDGVWAHTLGHEFPTPRVAHPIWGSSQVMREIWSKHDTYPNVVEQC